MTTQNGKSPLTRNVSGQENGAEIQARALSSADNGSPCQNFSQGNGPAPEQASHAADERTMFVKLMGYDRPETEGVAVDVWDSQRATWLEALAFARAASANETGAEGATVGAWVAEDDRAITAAQKQRALDEGGATASAVRPYSIPCYLGIPPAMAAEAVAYVCSASNDFAPIVRDKGAAQRLSDAHGDGKIVPLYAAPRPAQAEVRVGLTDALRRAREELSIVEWENDPPSRVVKLFDEIDALLTAHPDQPKPIDMLLYCPKCGVQHIDHAEPAVEHEHGAVEFEAWDNPPHRSHLCHACGTIWRPADVPTNGVAAIQTRGKADTWSGKPEPRASAGVIAAARAVIQADRAQTLTTDHVDALDNAIKIQRGELTLPEPRAEVTHFDVNVDAIAKDCRGEFDESGGIYFTRKFWGAFVSDIRDAIDAARTGASSC